MSPTEPLQKRWGVRYPPKLMPGPMEDLNYDEEIDEILILQTSEFAPVPRSSLDRGRTRSPGKFHSPLARTRHMEGADTDTEGSTSSASLVTDEDAPAFSPLLSPTLGHQLSQFPFPPNYLHPKSVADTPPPTSVQSPPLSICPPARREFDQEETPQGELGKPQQTRHDRDKETLRDRRMDSAPLRVVTTRLASRSVPDLRARMLASAAPCPSIPIPPSPLPTPPAHPLSTSFPKTPTTATSAWFITDSDRSDSHHKLRRAKSRLHWIGGRHADVKPPTSPIQAGMLGKPTEGHRDGGGSVLKRWKSTNGLFNVFGRKEKDES